MKKFEEIKHLPFDASGIDNPQNYYWEQTGSGPIYYPNGRIRRQNNDWVILASAHREAFMEVLDLLARSVEETPTLTNLLFASFFDEMESDEEATEYMLNSVPSEAVQYVIHRIDLLEPKKPSLLDKIKIEVERDATAEQKRQQHAANLKAKLYADLDLLKKDLPMFRVTINPKFNTDTSWNIQLDDIVMFYFKEGYYELLEEVSVYTNKTHNIKTLKPNQFTDINEFFNSPQFFNVIKQIMVLKQLV